MFKLVIICAVFAIVLVSAIGIGIYKDYQFQKNCGDYLKLAADAPNIERAQAFLEYAINYIELHKLTSGNTAVIFLRPDADLEIWYRQLKGAQKTLVDILRKTEISQLERDNALMKLREVLTDIGRDGSEITVPTMIFIYPYAQLFAFIVVISFFGFLFCFFIIVANS